MDPDHRTEQGHGPARPLVCGRPTNSTLRIKRPSPRRRVPMDRRLRIAARSPRRSSSVPIHLPKKREVRYLVRFVLLRHAARRKHRSSTIVSLRATSLPRIPPRRSPRPRGHRALALVGPRRARACQSSTRENGRIGTGRNIKTPQPSTIVHRLHHQKRGNRCPFMPVPSPSSHRA